ncbi:Acyltransferase LovD [Cyphellophora attinorum]|uniref:Acyltransferase LovD n=1 Tax=Cyphellophora attinorum TaxID=1664694 RepID=A0A0N0NMY6_9EURO|nr:Acyltransferase LovD [Phialophora attinorum]KPI40759.1 Acyltransferase LovD [Phialophora attinorum]
MDKLDSLLEACTANNAYPGTAATIVDSKGNRLYHKAFGVNDISAENPTKFTTSTQMLIFSCTKLIACIAALQLVEQGKLSLDDPVSKYIPDIVDIPVYVGDGTTATRPQKTTMTIQHLFTHTAGFTYDFFDKTTLQWRVEQGAQPGVYMAEGNRPYFRTPLLHDPGTAFAYGVNIDYLGLVLEAITGQKLQDYVKANILEPLDMKSSVPYLEKEDATHLLLHIRGLTGKDPLMAFPGAFPPKGLEFYGGGHYLISTVDDYAQILTTILNDGTSPTTGATILKPETVDNYLFKDMIPADADRKHVPIVNSSLPMSTNQAEFLPGHKVGWSCGFLLNLEDVPGGRKSYSGMWAGLGNLFFFIDRKSDRAGLVATSVLPFMDDGVLTLFEAVEKAALGHEIRDGAEAKTLFRVDS